MSEHEVDNMSRTDIDFRNYIAQSLRDGKERMDRIERDVKTNNDMTVELKHNTQDLLDILTTAKGGLKVLGGLGAVLKWVVATGGAAVALWAMFTGKIPPGSH